jgi:lysozyme
MSRDPDIPAVVTLVITAAIAAVLLWPRRSAAAVAEPASIDWWNDSDPNQPGNFNFTWNYGNPFIMTPTYDHSQALRAFLYMIRRAEHEERFSDEETYRLFYSSIPFTSYADHPVITGEVKPVRLPDRFCAPAGLRPPCYTTAAGAYQIIRPTWQRVRQEGAWGPYLADFSPPNQDEAARRLLLERGALAAIDAGDFARAVRLAAPVWASLPGSTAQQGGKSFDQVLALYNKGLMVA